ncbi:MAG: selenocysteine-specific translation elongation factor [Actinomycetota bacterium]
MYVLGTAGHVDHGKSTLIHALTGIDPDRLAEEKRRGLTIDLGFAWLEIGGREVGIVDVPGHERFVHNMLAGAGSVDATIFVVAANEGWMPQSEEHLQILDLLSVRGGVIALTKADMVDAEEIDIVSKEISERLKDTALDGAPIITVSATTGAGLDKLCAALRNVLDHIEESPDTGRPRVFVDRSFSVKGAGTVVTGTLTHGSLRAGDDVLVAPAGIRTKIRSIQTHKRGRDRAEPGSRVALNLAGLERHEIKRGDAIIKPGQWLATAVVGAQIKTTRTLSHPLTSRGAYKLYVGSAEVDARVTLLEASPSVAGTSFARLTLSEPVVATEGDRFVLRDASRDETVGGGVILDAHPVSHRVSREILRERLVRRASVLPSRAGSFAVHERGAIATESVPALAGDLAPSTIVLRSHVADPDWLAAAVARIEDTLGQFHARSPLERGMPKDFARRESGFTDAALFADVVEHSPRITADGTLLRLASHEVRLSPQQAAERDRLLDEISGLAPPKMEHLEQRFGRSLLQTTVASGEVIRIGEFAFASASVENAKEAIRIAIERNGPLTAAHIRDLLGTSRKYLIPLLEYLDAAGFTRRIGDLRRLR